MKFLALITFAVLVIGCARNQANEITNKPSAVDERPVCQTGPLTDEEHYCESSSILKVLYCER